MKDVLKEIIPPDLGPIARWRLAIFICSSVSILFMCWAVSPIGFALAEDVEKTNSMVKEVRLAQMEQYLFDAKETECSSDNAEARRFFAKRVLTLSREYSTMAGMKMDIPPCPKTP
jgi:hypothetical protein